MNKIADKVEIDAQHYKFLVDGEKFPWHITVRGPTIRRLADDLYGIKVEILCSLEKKSCGFRQDDYESDFSMGGITFPWAITDQGFSYVSKNGNLPVLTLEFLAHDVQADILIEEQREV